MALPKLTLANGQFVRNGQRFVPFGAVYFGRKPGTCGGDYFCGEWWPDARRYLEQDFARMAEIGCTWVAPFVNTIPFWKKGKPVEKVWKNLDEMAAMATRYGLYLAPFPHPPNTIFEDVMGRPYRDDPAHPHKHSSVNEQIFEFTTRVTTAFADRYRNDTAVPIIMTRGGGRLWTGYAGYGAGQPEGKELLPVKGDWQRWLQQRYGDDFAAFLKSHPRLPEQPKSWAQVALPVEVEGQFTEHDSRTFDFLAFSAEVSGRAQKRLQDEVHKAVPGSIMMFPFEGCEFDRGAMEVYLPGIADLDAVWVEMYQFGMTHSTHTHPDWEREHWFEPTTGKQAIDMLSVITEAWRRARYLKAAAPKTALICCHGTVLDNLMRWTPEPRDQRIIFERIQRTYLDAGADALAFWCWTDDETSSRPEPEFFYREGEALGVLNYTGQWRPVARRMAAYTKAATLPPRVSQDVLMLLPTPHLMGLDRIDTFTTAACVVSGLARLGVAPEVKASYFRGQGPIPLKELTPYKLVILGADEYRKDLPGVPAVLRKYVERGGHLLFAMGAADELLSPTLEPLRNADLAALTGAPRVLATNHQHTTHWFKSVRWQLCDGFLPYWDARRGRWMPGRGEKRLTYKFIDLPADATLLAEAAVPNPAENQVAYGSEVFAGAGENKFWPLFYRRPLGKGAVYVLTYTLNVFRSHLDEIDVQRDDWDWVLQAAIDDAGVTTDPCHSLSVLAQEFLNFRPTR